MFSYVSSLVWDFDTVHIAIVTALRECQYSDILEHVLICVFPYVKWDIGHACLRTLLVSLMTLSTQIAAPPNSTKSRNSDFSVSRSTKSKLRLWLNLNLCQRIWVSGFGGFRGCGIFSGICHSCVGYLCLLCVSCCTSVCYSCLLSRYWCLQQTPVTERDSCRVTVTGVCCRSVTRVCCWTDTSKVFVTRVCRRLSRPWWVALSCLSRCNTLQHTATHCNTLQHTATHCNTLQHTAQHFNTLQHTATHCNTLQHTATHCSTLQHTATHCRTTTHTAPHSNTLQHTATHCNTLQHIAAHCNTLQHTA